jgi:glutamyl-tRNA synthetase
MTKVVTRFAPSPTGHLHIGGARTAIFNWLLARHFGGTFLLRIEDTDQERSLQEYTDSILASMRWLGLDWDGEPIYQSRRFDIYNGYIDRMLETGHAYWCECSPEEVEQMRETARARGLKPKYDGRCRERGLGPGPGRVVRLKAPLAGRVVFEDVVKGALAFDAAELDDMVLRRADGTPTYNMAVVVDDAAMGVTHVLRGDDHVSNTPKQVLIYQALGLPLPVFGHVPMILGPDKKKLSKRHGARAVIEYEQDGLLPQALVNYLVRLGWSFGDQEIFALSELVEKFTTDNLNSAPAAFDPDKLQWLNAHYLRETPVDELARLAAPFVKAEGFDAAPERLAALAPLFRERASNLADLAKVMRFMLVDAAALDHDPAAVTKALTAEGKAHVAALRGLLEKAEPFDKAALEKVVHDYVEQGGLKFKQVGPPLRVALAGSLGGPGLPEIMDVLGRAETLARLDRAATLG